MRSYFPLHGLGELGRQRLRHIEALASRPPGIEQQDTVAFGGAARLDPDIARSILLAARTAVVERDLEGGALKGGRSFAVAACQAGLCLRCCGKGFSAAEAVAGVSAGISAATALARQNGAIRLLRTWPLRVSTCGTHSPLRTRKSGESPAGHGVSDCGWTVLLGTYGPGVGHGAHTQRPAPPSGASGRCPSPLHGPRRERQFACHGHSPGAPPPRTLTPRPRGLHGLRVPGPCPCVSGTRNCDTSRPEYEHGARVPACRAVCRPAAMPLVHRLPRPITLRQVSHCTPVLIRYNTPLITCSVIPPPATTPVTH